MLYGAKPGKSVGSQTNKAGNRHPKWTCEGQRQLKLTCFRTHLCATFSRKLAAGNRILSRLMPARRGYFLITSWFTSSMSARPIMSSTFRNPMAAMCSRMFSATMKKKLMACSGSPANLARSTGSCNQKKVMPSHRSHAANTYVEKLPSGPRNNATAMYHTFNASIHCTVQHAPGAVIIHAHSTLIPGPRLQKAHKHHVQRPSCSCVLDSPGLKCTLHRQVL